MGESAYTIQRSPTSTFTSPTTWQSIGYPPPTTFIDTGGGTGSYYRIRAENGAGISGWSNTAIAGAAGITVAPPSNLTGTLLTGPAVGLNWKDNSNNR